MGWTAKVVAFAVAVLVLEAGILLIGIPLMLYALSGLWRKRDLVAGRPRGGSASTAAIAGLVLLGLSGTALLSGGVLSPFVFGSAGAACIFYSRWGTVTIQPNLRPVDDSLLLRDRVLWFRWYAVAEVKLVTRRPSKPLSAVKGTLVVRADGRARAFVVMETASTGRRGAEVRLGRLLGEVARSLMPMGAYLFPLEGASAVAAVSCSTERTRLGEEEVGRGVATIPFAVVSVEVSGLHVHRIGVFGGKEGRAVTALPGQRVRKPITLWELASALEKRLEWAPPDEIAVFLTSLAATRGQEIGERLESVGNPGEKTWQVRSLRSPAVQLTGSQMQMLMEIYS